MINTLFLILMAPPANGEASNPIASFLPIILIIFVFYFFMIRPQMKKTKEHKKYMESIKVGDKIITVGGLHGKVVEINDNVFSVEISPNVKVKVERSAIVMDTNTINQTK